jgi:hypothetical protein
MLSNSITNTTTSKPQEVVDIVITHYRKTAKGNTRASPKGPMDTTTKPGQLRSNFSTSPHHITPRNNLDIYITRSHYDRAATIAPENKAPGHDAITNEPIKHLP